MQGKAGSTGIDDAFACNWGPGIGAEIMGRNKFGPQRGPWADEEWKGWWGDDPPFHTPVFVLTHHLRPAIEMKGGTTFHFIDASPAEALEAAREAAGGLDVRIGGGPTTVREFLAANLVDYMHIAVVPIVLGRGERLWDDLGELEQRFEIEATFRPAALPISPSLADRDATCQPTLLWFAPISAMAMTAGTSPLLDQRWRVPFWM